MAQARTVAQVVAGEATSGTPEERWADMVHVYSVISNRARQLGVPVEDVISAMDENGNKQFDAYGKELPPGVGDDLVSMAEKAVSYVNDYGPVTKSGFYATPSAADGLPPGLSFDTSTTGHQYFSDPLGRSILTAQGYQTPTDEEPSRLMTPFDNSPLSAYNRMFNAQPAEVSTGGLMTPYAAPYDPSMEPGQQAIQGILSETPVPPEDVGDEYGLLGPAALADINATPASAAHRPYAPQEQVIDNIQGAVTSVLGPGARVQVTSGTEGGLAQFGSNRHKTGLAADIAIYDPSGNKLSWQNPSDLQVMKDIAQSAATQQASIGLGYNNPNMMHVDYVPSSDLGPGQDQSWGRIGNDPEFAGLLADARTYGTMPASFYDKAAERVVANNVIPTFNSPAAMTQATATDGFSGLLNPITSEPIEKTDLPPGVASFADAYAAQRGPTSGVNGAEMQAMQGHVEYAAQKAREDPQLNSFPSLDVPTTASMPSQTNSLTSNIPAYQSFTPAPGVFGAYDTPRAMAAVQEQSANDLARAIETPMFNQTAVNSIPGLASENNPYGLDPMVAINAQPASALDPKSLVSPTDIASSIQPGLLSQPAADLNAQPAMTEVASADAKSSVPSYADAMANVAQPMSVETAMAMQTPNFNQAMNPTMPGMMSAPIGPSQYQINREAQMSQIPGTIAAESMPAAVVEGPATTPALDQQTQAAVTPTNTVPSTISKPATQNKGMLSGLLSPETALGGLLGGLALGPAGGLVGALAGQQIARNGGLSNVFSGGGFMAPTTQMAGGINNIASIYGGTQAPGTFAVANNGATITAQPGGYSTYTNSYGVTEAIGPDGKISGYFGSNANPTSPDTETSSGGLFGGLFG